MTAKKQATYDDIIALPENMVGQIVDGELYASPRPASPHAHVSSALGGDLQGPFHRGRGGPGGWWILDEPELHLGRHVLVPDMAGWRRTRMPVLENRPFIDWADWICEILSPTTASLDRIKKLPIYAEHGVGHAWIIDPLAHTLEIYRLASSVWVLAKTFEGDGVIRAEPFDAIELEMGAWWLPAAPPSPA